MAAEPIKIRPRMKPDVYERLRTAMDARGIITAPALAKLCGLKESTARAYANGTRSPSLEACEKIAKCLQVSGVWLYYGRGAMDAPREEAGPPHNVADLIFAAVEEAFLQLALKPEEAKEIASVVQLAVATGRPHPGMSAVEAIRRVIRWEVPEILGRQR